MVESCHKLIDNLVCVFLSFSGQVKIAHGCLQALVSHVALKDPDVYALFQQMGGVAVPQGMDRKLL